MAEDPTPVPGGGLQPGVTRIYRSFTLLSKTILFTLGYRYKTHTRGAKRSEAKRSEAKRSEAKQSEAKRSEAKQSEAKQI